jgi:hypothetical protein
MRKFTPQRETKRTTLNANKLLILLKKLDDAKHKDKKK